MTALDPDLHCTIMATTRWVDAVAKAVFDRADTIVGPKTEGTEELVVELARELDEACRQGNPTQAWISTVARMHHRTKRWAECIQTQRDALNGRHNRRVRRMDGLDGHPVIHLAEALLSEAERR